MQAMRKGAAATDSALARAPSTDYECHEAVSAQLAAGCNRAHFLRETAPTEASLAQWALDSEAAAVLHDTMAHLQMLCDHLERAAAHASGAERDAGGALHTPQQVVRTPTGAPPFSWILGFREPR